MARADGFAAWLARAALIVALFAAAPAERSLAADQPPALAALVETRTEIAAELVKPIAACVARRDTSHAVFRGCIDWHSAVHGVWALIAYERATGDAQYRAVWEPLLTPKALLAEARLLLNKPFFEMPYGRAWFLRLAIEHRRLTGEDRLDTLASIAFESLASYYWDFGVDPQSTSYDSAAWALINMLDYAEARNDAEAAALVRDAARAAFYEGAPRCQPRREGRGFMAHCVTWAWLLSKTLPAAEFGPWLQRSKLAENLPKSVAKPRGAHHFGLNFSRAWGLWGLYQATGDRRFARAYAGHVRQTYRRPAHWRGDYRKVGHWVAQFGLFAIQPLFGPEAGR